MVKYYKLTQRAKNLEKENVINQCDDRQLKLTGNFLININNCSINVLNVTIFDYQLEFIQKFHYEDETKMNITKN